ncbi:hypothetical protein DESAMIL20_877 [Desulfurella amilsii]|uniref:DUF4258 domain-containing protein n=1 Tax=Desulfurella amilsii TaxID=1562698 RepID=A0A1X4XUW6_9BACT|nr:DUF4258 domain-containing protein [Desulfurella amilsii]OSS41324.1 hypothetical protein DESAMIL20_877 [Desulfurella amilsii]
MLIVWTKHAQERLRQWQYKINIDKNLVEEILLNPPQIVSGDLDVLVAQSKIRNGLIRVPFKKEGETLKILTIYYTTKIEKYWRDKDEN